MRLPTTVATHVISVAITQVPIPTILRPSVISVVTSNPTNVVTRAIPPSKYGAFCVAILVISGSKIVVDAVKIQTATTNARPLWQIQSRVLMRPAVQAHWPKATKPSEQKT